MQVAKLNEHALAEAFGILMATIEVPPSSHIGASYGVVPPGSESTLHRHDEAELFIVLSGEGLVVSDTQFVKTVTAGDAVFVEPFEKHVLKNPGGDALVFVDLYWRDSTLAGSRSEMEGEDDFNDRPIFVFSTPPTPNGDLHLGHLSGPYLGADVYTRFQRMRGRQAFHLTGSDDFQSYVVAKARELNSDPKSVADKFANEIKATLDSMDVEIHQFTSTSTTKGYQSAVQDFFDRLVSSGGVTPSNEPAAFDRVTGAYLYECDISGECPGCRAPCGGNICEECGEPNLAVDLLKPVSKLSAETPVIAQLERHIIPLHDHREYLLAALKKARAAPRLHALAEKVLAKDGLHVSITHPQAWGVPPRKPAGPQQVIWAWPEMAFGFLFGIEALGTCLSNGWRADSPEDKWKIVHFFGYDNSFYHTMLYPALYKVAYPQWSPDIDYHVNEFYLLDGLKFSTSRQHAVWGKEVLGPDSVDCVRFHLCLTRGEVERTNFDRLSLERTKANLTARWDGWLSTLGQIIARDFNGVAPDAGDWSREHQAFLSSLQQHLRTIEFELSPNKFSLNSAAAALDRLVDNVTRFSFSQRHLEGSAAAYNRNRTTAALQLAAALLLADTAAPLMPRFARKLRTALGAAPERPWPDHVELLEPGSHIKLGKAHFFSQTKPDEREIMQPAAQFMSP
ncbi:class I tRNA ligase family protein [Rhizobium pusense]|uniref:class I tRNA ligase family protein n=1 Tax=Agrobacterium pusense TaxID=648995 RepID=UPI00244CF297|nr:class I tRNA ligase family protein [Agrobacterium pusense]MDH1270469.1 class I tRNA ligase family protein [Agrobacterium pusense]